MRFALPALLLLFAAPASAQCLLCGEQPGGPAPAADEADLRIDIDAGLTFRRVAMTGPGGGQVAVDPATGLSRASGDIADLAGANASAHVRVTGAPGRLVRIELPSRIVLSGPGGATAELRDIRSTLPRTPRLDANGQLEFDFAGTLAVADPGPGGDFRGAIPVTASYE